MTAQRPHEKGFARQHADFLFEAYCGLVLRGFDREREIGDPILRKVWRLGKRIGKAKRAAERTRR